MGKYEWRNPEWVREIVSTGEIPEIEFKTDSSALGNQVRSGFEIEVDNDLANQFKNKGIKQIIDKTSEKLKNNTFGIYANGDLLDKSKINLKDEGFSAQLEISKWQSKEGSRIAEMITGKKDTNIVPNNSRVHTVKDLFQVTGVGSVSLKPFKSTSSSSNNKNMSQQSSNMSINKITEFAKQNKLLLAGIGLIGFMVMK